MTSPNHQKEAPQRKVTIIHTCEQEYPHICRFQLDKITGLFEKFSQHGEGGGRSS